MKFIWWIVLIICTLFIFGLIITIAEYTNAFQSTQPLGPILLGVSGGIILVMGFVWLNTTPDGTGYTYPSEQPSSLNYIAKPNYVDTEQGLFPHSPNATFGPSGTYYDPQYGTLHGPKDFPVFFTSNADYLDTDQGFLSGEPGTPIPYSEINYKKLKPWW